MRVIIKDSNLEYFVMIFNIYQEHEIFIYKFLQVKVIIWLKQDVEE